MSPPGWLSPGARCHDGPGDVIKKKMSRGKIMLITPRPVPGDLDCAEGGAVRQSEESEPGQDLVVRVELCTGHWSTPRDHGCSRPAGRY